MTTFASVALVVYAVLMLVGGIIGYRTAGSRPSLISGAISAVLLFGALGWTRVSPRAGFLAAAFVALLLAIVFTLRFMKTRSFMPPGMLLILSLIALVIFAAASLGAVGA